MDIPFSIASEEVQHARYLTVYSRKVEFQRPEGPPVVVDYDVVGHPKCEFRFCVVRREHTATCGSFERR